MLRIETSYVEGFAPFIESHGVKAMIHTLTQRIDVPAQIDFLKIDKGIDGQPERLHDIPDSEKAHPRLIYPAIAAFHPLFADFINS